MTECTPEPAGVGQSKETHRFYLNIREIIGNYLLILDYFLSDLDSTIIGGR